MTIQEVIDKSDRICFFGGAGVSTESGIPDFRSSDGIYNMKYKYSPEEIISHDFFYEHTEEFYKFYLDKMVYPDAKPNIAHYKLAELENAGKLLSVVTQNIDGLHQKAGSKRVIELHGSVLRNTCTNCGQKFDLDYLLNSKTTVPKCKCGGIIKPDVVLYGESLNELDLEHAINDIQSCDTLIVAGTSLNVYPAAGLIRYFRGDNLVLINKDKTPYDNICNIVIHDKLGNIFKDIKI